MMMANALFLSILLAAIFSYSEGYPTNRGKIPNGYNVSNPCNESLIWNGVGHKNSGGGGPLNPFGEDFRANNQVWNRTVCQMDSDGDGKPNGEELGDPNCIWTPGSTPTYTTNISHPGICDPIESPNCTSKNSWLMNCKSKKFNCPAINDPGVQNITLRFQEQYVPGLETVSQCRQFRFPNDTSADIIAIEPVIDNTRVLHHMLLFGCKEEFKSYQGNESFYCDMESEVKCQSLIGSWTIFGDFGQCFSRDFGFRIGPAGFQSVLLQLIWNNSQKFENQHDSSGMRIYYTNQRRPNEGGIVVVGQEYLEIPPGRQDVTFTGRCSSACTRQLPYSVFFVSVVLYMHLIGKAGSVSLYRNGSLLKTLEDVKVYNNMPVLVTFENPIELKPGDQIGITCVYNSTSRNTVTYNGERKTDEMCYAFIAYYPQLTGIDFCGQWKTIDKCDESIANAYFDKCDLQKFAMTIKSLLQECQISCISEDCHSQVKNLYATGCYDYEDVKAYVKVFIPALLIYLQSCSPATTTPVSEASGLNLPYGSGILLSLVAYANYHRLL